MVKLIANRKIRYPRTVEGKEYEAGDEFECTIERDINVLTKTRLASLAPEGKMKTKAAVPKPPAPPPQPVPPPQQPQPPQPTAPMSTENTDDLLLPRYLRRDMRPKED